MFLFVLRLRIAMRYSKFPTVLWLVLSRIRRVLSRIGSLTRGWAALSVIGATGLGFTMIQVDEYFAADLCRAIAAVILVCKSFYWFQHETQKGYLTLRIIGVCGTVVIFALIVLWTSLKRGSKPQSNFSVLLQRTERIVKAFSFPVTPPIYALRPPYADYIPKSSPTTRAPHPKNEPLSSEAVLSASLAHPSNLVIFVENISSLLAEDIRWALVAFRVSDPVLCSYQPQNIGYLKAHSRSANYAVELNSLPHAPQTPQLSNGDRLVGTISVDCPKCKGTTLVVDFTWGVGGSFYVLPEGNGNLILPRRLSGDNITRYIEHIENSIPLNLRHQIVDIP